MTGPAAIASSMCRAIVVSRALCSSSIASVWLRSHLSSALAMLALLTPPVLRGWPPCHIQPRVFIQHARMMMCSPPIRRTGTLLVMVVVGGVADAAVAAAFGDGCEKGRTMAESAESSTAMLSDGVVGCACGAGGAGGKVGLGRWGRGWNGLGLWSESAVLAGCPSGIGAR